MEYIIRVSSGLYFGGWDPVLGKMIFTGDKNLSYRMRRPLALKTLEKMPSEYPDAEIEKI